MDKTHQRKHNVVSMSDYMPQTGYAAISQVEAYWHALRGNQLVPRRSEIDPRGLDGALEYAFVLERIATGIARLRVAGSHLNDLMGMEVRGMPLTTFFAPTQRRMIADTLEEMFQTPAVALLNLSAPAAPARPALEARLLLLPLKSDLNDISRALGCFVAKGDIGAGPRRFDITGHTFTPLIPGNTVRTDTETSVPSPSEQMPNNSGFAENNVAFDRPNSKRPPYLRLVKSDNDPK